MKHIVIFGCGGHAKVILDIINSSGQFKPAAFFDRNPKSAALSECPIFSDLESLSAYATRNALRYAVVAIGNNEARQKLSLEAKRLGLELPAIFHPSAVVSKSANIGDGTVVMPRAVINSTSKIGVGCIINTGSIIEHDCTIGDYTHIAPGSVLCGGVTVGDNVLFGAGSVAIPMMRVGSNTTLGAGSIVVSTIPEGVRAMGNPARVKN